MPDGNAYPLQFKDDADWLENSYFAITKSGKFAVKPSHCNSHPSWPNGK